MCITLMTKMGWNVTFCEEEFAGGNLVQASEKNRYLLPGWPQTIEVMSAVANLRFFHDCPECVQMNPQKCRGLFALNCL